MANFLNQVGLKKVFNLLMTYLGGTFIPLSQKGRNNGVATLNADGMIPYDQLQFPNRGQINTSELDSITLRVGIYNVDDEVLSSDILNGKEAHGILIQYPGGSRIQVLYVGREAEAIDGEQVEVYIRRYITTTLSWTGWSKVGNESIPDVSTMKLVTYAELKNLRDSAKLVPGMRYRITDFVTTASGVYYKSAGHPFDIIVVADSEDTLNENVKAALHEGDTYFANNRLDTWELRYCLDNDQDRFLWADTDGKGVIYYMKDENCNELPYDFRNIQFKVKLTNGVYDKFDGEDTWCYTFSNWIDGEIIDILSLYKYFSGNVNNNILRSKVKPHEGKGIYINVFIHKGPFTDSNRFTNNVLGDGCNNNVFGNDCNHNVLGEGCNNNVFGNDCNHNVLGDGCNNNVFGNYCNNNVLGDGCYSNVFGNYCYSNDFGNDCYSNVFGNDCNHNDFGNYCYSNDFGNDCNHNDFGNGCNNNVLVESCIYNDFGNDCSLIKFNSNFTKNAIVESHVVDVTLIIPIETSNYIKICSGVRNKTINHSTVEGIYQVAYKASDSVTEFI